MPPVALYALLSAPALAETHAPGAVIENAAFLDVPPEGFDAVGAIVPSVIPSSIAIDDTSGGDCNYGSYDLSGAWVSVEVADTEIVPMDGYLDVTITLNVQLNDASDPFDLTIGTFFCLVEDTCYGHVEPFPVTIHTTLAMDVTTDADGNPALDATVGAIEFSYDLDTEDDIVMEDCAIGDIEEVLGYLGLDLYGWLISFVEPTLESAVTDLGPTLETTIEEAFSAANIEQDLDLNGIALHVQLFPGDVQIDPSGMRVVMSGAVSTDAAAECVAEYDPGGSLATPSDPPEIGDLPDGVTEGYHLAIDVSDDFANQGLYALWSGGLLCYTLGADAGLPLDTSTVLGVLAGDAFDALFPEAQPITIQTRPRAAPTLGLTGSHDLNVVVSELGLEVYAELDGRLAKIIALDLGVQAGADLNLDGTTGELAIALDLGTDSMDCAVLDNEFAADSTDEIESQCAGALGSLAGTVLSGLLSDLSFVLPSFGTLGLTAIEAEATGPSQDWLGIFAWIGDVPYGSADSTGCASDGSGGCTGADSGCSGGGCAAGGRPLSRWSVIGLAMGAAFLLRRRP